MQCKNIVALNPSYLEVCMYIVTNVFNSSLGGILKVLNVFFFAAKGYVSSGNISGLS